MLQFIHRFSREMLFQAILIGILSVAIMFDKRNPGFSLSEALFFVSYVVAALVIGYVLLPKFFYQKKYIHFSLGVIAVLVMVVLVEEFVLEKIFFPDSRGTFFPGLVPTLIEVMPVILILVGFKFAWDAQKKQSQLEQLNTIVAESRLQFLKTQINPHFLFNNLNNLYAYSLENSSKTSAIILELSSLLRYMLYDCRAKLVPLEKEIQCLQDFIRLQELQIEHRGNIEFLVSGKIGEQMIAPLILIVFIENCFKHSTSSLVDGIQIRIALHVTADTLVMECQNSFSHNANTEELSQGIGLENVQSRLELLYPNAHVLKISHKDHIFQVHLELNLNEVA